MNTTTREAIREALINDEDLAHDLFSTLLSYSGFGSEDAHYEMEMIDEFFEKPSDILTSIFCGYDEYYKNERGEHTESFNPNREYFYFNGYGNLVSTDEPTPATNCINEMLDEIENDNYGYLPSEIEEILEAEESEEE